MWFQDLFQLRLPPHRDVRDSLRHSGRRDFLLRLQHWRGLAADHREHAQDGNLAEWYEENGRHKVYAAGKPVPLNTTKHSLSLPIVQAVLAEDADEKPAIVSPYLVETPEEETVSVQG